MTGGGEAARKRGRLLAGKVMELRPNGIVRVRLEDGHEVDCHLAGRQRVNVVRLVPGSPVTVETSPFDLNRGRIVEEGKQS